MTTTKFEKSADWPRVLAHRGFWHDYYQLRLEPEEDGTSPASAIFGADAHTDMPPDLRDLFNPDAEAMEELLDLTDDDEDPRAAAERLIAEELTDDDDVESLTALIVRAREGDTPDDKVLPIPLVDAFVWLVQFAPNSITHRLAHPELQGSLYLGHDDAHFSLPILQWSEVTSLVAVATASWRGCFDARYVPLLLNATTFVAAEDDIEAIRRQVIDDWRQAKVLDDDACARIARAITHDESRVRWRREAFGWVNDGDNSRRNPSQRGGEGFGKANGWHWLERLFGAVRDFEMRSVTVR